MTKAVLVREDGTLGPTALQMVEDMAAANKTQGTIASALGLSKKKFENLLNRQKGECPERLAWERGHAKLEQTVADSFYASGVGKLVEEVVKDEHDEPVIDEATGKPKTQMVRYISKAGHIGLMFYAKAQLGWTEKPTGPFIQENRIQITLPGSMTGDQYLEMLGMPGLLDFRKDKSKPMPSLKDVSGEVKALPAPAAPQEDCK